MNYVSTRGKAPILPFDDVLLAGLARDGGLYVPATWPALDTSARTEMAALSYADLAFRVVRPFVGGTISDDDLAAIVADSYAGFDHPDVAPLCALGKNEWLMELFHGPTIAFKDYALQLLGRLFDHVLKVRGQRVTIVAATSGDTGSAAIEACRGRDAIDIFVLHPKGRVSDVQRRQMTTVRDANVHNIAIEGTFDDCQDMVKAMFNDETFRDAQNLSAVNSINWARIMAQVAYYVRAWSKIEGAEGGIDFSVPTGNFGNVFAGYVAKHSGLPIERLIIGSNRNDILTRFFETATMQARDVIPTLSPSMDIQISSNFERLLFDLMDRDGARVSETLEAFRRTGSFTMDKAAFEKAIGIFSGARFDDEETKATIKQVFDQTGMLLDPHSAVGVAAARRVGRQGDRPMVVLATAHPAKFPDAVKAATGQHPELPPHMADLFEREEKMTTLPNDLGQVQAFVAGLSRANG